MVELARPWYPGVMRVHPYNDRQGRPVYFHVRVDAGDHPSKFRWCTVSEDRKNLVPGKNSPGTGSVVEPLYRYGQARLRLEELGPDVLYICEGEKDCDALWDAGFIAVCSPDGASKLDQRIKWKEFYTDALRDMQEHITCCVIVADADEPGFWTGEMLALTLEHGIQPKVYRAYPDEEDLSDHFEAGGAVGDLNFCRRFPTKGDAEAKVRPLPQALHRPSSRSNGGGDYGHMDDGQGRVRRGEYDESGYAEHFADHYGGKAKFDHRRGLWLVFTGHHWQPDEDGQVDRWLKEMMYDRLRTAPPSDDNRVARTAVGFLSRNKRSAVRDLARSESPIADAGRDWNQHKGLLAVGNGVIDLRTGVRRPGQPEDKFSLWTPVDYHGLETPAPRWEQFLKEVFAGDGDVIDYLQRYLGYCCTGETLEQLMGLCRGTAGGANGKGKLFFVLRKALGWYVHTLPFTALATVGSDRGKAWSIADLPGKRLVLSSETQEGAWFSTDRIKALTGEDELNVEKKHQDPFTFTPVAKYLLAVNTLPNVPSDKAFWRRLRVFPFEVEFDQHSPAAQRLEGELLKELPGILAWLARGAKAWYESGLEPTPAVIKLATEEYEKGQDPLADYFEQRLELTPDDAPEPYWVQKSALRADYERYCRAHAFKPVDGWVKALEAKGLKTSTVTGEDKKPIAVWKGAKFKG